MYILRVNGEGYNLQDAGYIVYTGNFIGSHAEIRALDDLSKKIFTQEISPGVFVPVEVESGVYDLWIKQVYGYNRRIIDEGLMHTCADCSYITEGVTFIKLRVKQ
jgi:hypothetical protein